MQTDSDEGKFGKDSQTKGGADKSTSFDVDSNLGLQTTGTLNSWLSGTVQVLVAKRDKGHVEPAVEWAFVNVKPADGLSLRAGRMAAPVFAVSDSRNVGYANTWVRAPNEAYGLNPFRNMQGIDGTYQASVGSATVSLTGFGGKTGFKSLGIADATGENLKGLNLQVETDWASIRLGRMTTKVVIPDFGETGDVYSFSGVGVAVDRENVVFQTEFVQRRSAEHPDAVNADGWYLMGGYRFGKVLPYVIRSATRPKVTSSPFLVTSEQTATALGIRWDAFSSVALKFQIDHIDTNHTKGISFATPPTPPVFPGAPPGSAPLTKPVNVISVAADFTF